MDLVGVNLESIQGELVSSKLRRRPRDSPPDAGLDAADIVVDAVLVE